MGHSLEPVLFCSDELRIKPHTATKARYIGRPVSIREFAGSKRVNISKRDDNGEFVVQKQNSGHFMEGPLVLHT